MRTNRCAMLDVCTLLSVTRNEDASGHYEEEEFREEVFCTVLDGVNRAEFYEAAKAGVRLSLTVEVWEDDYDGQTRLEHEGRLYDIQRSYPSGHGTLELSCSEVIR